MARRTSLAACSVLLCATHTSYAIFANKAGAALQPQCRAVGSGGTSSGAEAASAGVPPALLILLVEACKLCVAATLWRLEERRSRTRVAGDLPGSALSKPATARVFSRKLLLFAPPALLYCASNVLSLVVLQHMVAAVYELVSTLKIVITAILAWLFAQTGATLCLHRWAAIALLLASNLLAQWRLDASVTVRSVDVGMVVLVVFCSSAASVCMERLTKERFLEDSMHLQNVQLYLLGVLFNGAAWLAMSSGGQPLDSVDAISSTWPRCVNMWHGCALLSLSLMGVVTSAVIKYHGNVARVVASSFAVHLSALFSRLASGFMPTPQFMAAAVLCQLAILLYHKTSIWNRVHTL